MTVALALELGGLSGGTREGDRGRWVARPRSLQRLSRDLARGVPQCEASLALGRHVTYAEVLDLAESGEPIADLIVGNGTRGLGTLIAAVANIALPERIILTGEGIRLAEVGWDRLVASIHANRNPEASALDIRVIPDDPLLWARGAASVAIQRTVLDDLRWSTDYERANAASA